MSNTDATVKSSSHSIKGKLNKSKSTKDVLKKGAMSSFRNLMGSLHSGHNKSMGHIEFCSDSEDEHDDFYEDNSDGLEGDSCLNNKFPGDQERRGSQNENVNGCQIAQDEDPQLFEAEDTFKRVNSAEATSTEDPVSPSPASPTSVIPVADTAECTASNSGHSSNKKSFKTTTSPQNNPSGRRLGKSSMQRAKSIGNLLVDDSLPPSPTGKAPPSTPSRRKGNRSIRKCKSLRNVSGNNLQGAGPSLSKSDQAKRETFVSPATSRQKRGNPSVRKSRSVRNLKITPADLTATPAKKDDIDMSYSARDRRSRGLRKNGSMDDPSMSSSSLRQRRRVGGLSMRKSRSVRDMRSANEDPSQGGACASASTRQRRGDQSARRSRSTRTLKVTDEDLLPPSSHRDASARSNATSRHRRGNQSMMKCKSMRSMRIADDALEPKDAVSPSPAQPTSTTSRHRRGNQSMRKCKSMRNIRVADDHLEKEDVPSQSVSFRHKRGNLSVRNRRSTRNLKSADENVMPPLQENTSSHSNSSRHNRGGHSIRKSKSVRSMSMTGAIAAPEGKGKPDLKQCSLSSPSGKNKKRLRKCQSMNIAGESSIATPPKSAAAAAVSSVHKSGCESMRRARSVRNLDIAEEAPASISSRGRPESKQGSCLRSRSSSRGGLPSASAAACSRTSRTTRSFVGPEDSRRLSRSMSMSLLTDPKWQCRSMSRLRDDGKSNNKCETGLEKRARSKSRGRARSKSQGRGSESKLSERSNGTGNDAPAQRGRSKSTTRSQAKEIAAGDTANQGSSIGANTGGQVCGSLSTRGRHKKKDNVGKPKRNRSKSLKGLKDLRTKLGHSTAPAMLSPKGANLSITSGSISSLTMSSRMYSYDDHSFASSQRSPFRRSFSTPRLFVAGNLSSSLLLEADEMSQDQPENNRGSRWASLPQPKVGSSMDVLPVAPDHDVSSYAGLPEGPAFERSISEGGRWSTSRGGSKGHHAEADTILLPPSHDTSSLCHLIAPDTPSYSVQSNTGLISELTPATLMSPLQKKLGQHETKKTSAFTSWMESLSTLLLEDAESGPPEVSSNPNKRDSIPRKVRRHSLDSTSNGSFSGNGSNGSGPPSFKSGLASALTQLDGEHDNAPRKPARRTSTGSSVQYIPSSQQAGRGATSTASIPEE